MEIIKKTRSRDAGQQRDRIDETYKEIMMRFEVRQVKGADSRKTRCGLN